MKVLKRDNVTVEDFNSNKISNAIKKAMRYSPVKVDNNEADEIAFEIEQKYIENKLDIVHISKIESDVFDALVKHNLSQVAKLYEGYRKVREYQRDNNTIDNKILGIINGTDDILNENSNKNDTIISTQRDLCSEEVSKDIAMRMMLPAHLAQANEQGIIHIHDLGHYLNRSFNCCLVNLKDMLDNGTVINGKKIDTPKSFRTACTISTQIIAQVASGQFGGQTITLTHLAPYVRISKNKIRNNVIDELNMLHIQYSDKDIDKITNKRLNEEVRDGIQTIQYQINTLQTSNGQSPFLSILMYINEDVEYKEETAMLIQEMLKQRTKGMKNEKNAWISPAFPKLIYVLDENNITEDSEYWHITELAVKCVIKRMMPDFISAKIMKLNYEGNVFGPMGCRAFLSPYKGSINNNEGEYKFYGRFNMGVTSINLLDVALSSNKDMDKFWEIFNDRLELVKESLILRYEKLLGTKSDVSPIHWQHGAIARLDKHETIDTLLKDGYATITLGYMGVYDAVHAMLGVSNTTEKGKEFALQIVKYMKDTVTRWKNETGLGFALYGTPAESLTEKFALSCRRRFGLIPGITDKDYLTNSFHVNVTEDIDPFDKLKYEAEFQNISSGGCISYIEMANMENNTEAVIEIVKYIYDNIQYAEFNTKSDYCQVCDFDGEMLLDENLEWYCPNCGNRDTDKINICRRTCGYLGENLWNKGRTQEISERIVHLDNHKLI